MNMLRQDYQTRVKEVKDAIAILEAQGKEKFSTEIQSLKIKLDNIKKSEDFNKAENFINENRDIIAIGCIGFIIGVLTGLSL